MFQMTLHCDIPLELKAKLIRCSDFLLGALFIEEVEILAEEICAVSREEHLRTWQEVLCTAHILVYLICVERVFEI